MSIEHEPRFQRAKAYFEIAADVRKFEIGLFWQRSLFFWGFLSAAFVAYGVLNATSDAGARLAVACFGLVCSVAWTLLNRGSKYWQEAWEQKTDRKEIDVLGEKLFARIEPVKPKFWVLRGRRYSVSKLLIALSDFVVLIWAYLSGVLLPIDWASLGQRSLIPWQYILLGIAVAYCIYVAAACHSSREE
jgi:hypothetical protein